MGKAIEQEVEKNPSPRPPPHCSSRFPLLRANREKMASGNEHSPLLVTEEKEDKRTPLRYALRFAGERKNGV